MIYRSIEYFMSACRWGGCEGVVVSFRGVFVQLGAWPVKGEICDTSLSTAAMT